MSIRWTEEQLAEHQARMRERTAEPPFMLPPDETPARKPARGMNKTEAAYAQHLEARRLAGEVLWWRFEPMRLRLANGAWFKPDFGVKLIDRSLEFHETKGFWREAARVRIKVAAELFPFRFIAVKRKGGGWEREEFS